MDDRTETAVTGESEIDLGPLPAFTGYALRRAQMAVFQDFYRTLAPLDLTPAEFSVLVLLSSNPGSRQRRLGEALGIQPSNFAVLAGQLVARGLVERRAHPADRRSLSLYLSEDGKSLLGEATKLARRHDRAMTAGLSKADHAKLLELLAVVTRAASS